MKVTNEIEELCFLREQLKTSVPIEKLKTEAVKRYRNYLFCRTKYFQAVLHPVDFLSKVEMQHRILTLNHEATKAHDEFYNACSIYADLIGEAANIFAGEIVESVESSDDKCARDAHVWLRKYEIFKGENRNVSR